MWFNLMTQRKLDKIEECYRGSYDNGLTHLKPINAGEYINGIGAEDSKFAHEYIVEYACSKRISIFRSLYHMYDSPISTNVDGGAKETTCKVGHHDCRWIVVDIVYH